MRSDTDLIFWEKIATCSGKARGGPVARRQQEGVPYRWSGTRLREQQAAPALPPEGYVLRIPPMRKLGRAFGRVVRWTVVLLLLGLLVLAAIPISSCGGCGEARSSEARAALGAMKDRARVVYQRTGKVPRSLKELGMSREELNGSYYSSEDYLIVGESAEEWSAVCLDVYTKKPSYLRLKANIVNGSATFNR